MAFRTSFPLWQFWAIPQLGTHPNMIWRHSNQKTFVVFHGDSHAFRPNKIVKMGLHSCNQLSLLLFSRILCWWSAPYEVHSSFIQYLFPSPSSLLNMCKSQPKKIICVLYYGGMDYSQICSLEHCWWSYCSWLKTRLNFVVQERVFSFYMILSNSVLLDFSIKHQVIYYLHLFAIDSWFFIVKIQDFVSNCYLQCEAPKR